jgi:FHA domain
MEKSAHKMLLVIQTPEEFEKLELSKTLTWTFGRSAKNEVWLKDPFASRYHAKLEITEEGTCYFTDLNSRNGTLLNGQPLTNTAHIKDGDRIEIGETTLWIEFGQEIAQDSPLVECSPSEQSAPSVLMVQSVLTQGEIWEEIFHSLSIPCVWKDTGANLRQVLMEQASTDTLPKLLLMDVRTHGNAYYFCRWCHELFPQMQVFLLDSMRKEIPKIERHIAQKNGAINLFSAMNRYNLILRSTEVLQDINEVLTALGSRSIGKAELLNTLRLVENYTRA